jgi:hypothetical protein
VPFAVFETDQPADLVAMLAVALPTPETLAKSSIARKRSGTKHDLDRQVTLDAFRERAEVERSAGDGLLVASVSDLISDSDLKPENLQHGAFDVPAPRGETLWSRAVNCAERLSTADLAERVRGTMNGSGRREKLNGLGFDAHRLPAGMHPVDEVGVHADPVIELLVLSALPLFPVRGDGRTIRQRLWTDGNTKRGAFQWIAWRPALDIWGIDALLDQPSGNGGPLLARYQVVPYQLADPNDRRAYFAERVA